MHMEVILMRLTNESKIILRDLMDKKMRGMLDWTDFLEDAGIPLHFLEEYLMCKRDELPDNHLVSIAYALGIHPNVLSDKLSENSENQALNNGFEINKAKKETPLEKDAKLEKQCKEFIMQGKRKEYEKPFNELWDLLEASKKSDERIELAKRLSRVLEMFGTRCYDNFDFLGLSGAYNDAYSLTQIIPESLDISLTCVRLAIRVFELKFRFNSFENVESYIDELLPVTSNFLDNEEFVVDSAACLCNLVQLCPYDRNVFASRMSEILAKISMLSDFLPQNATLQLCYLRSLVFFLCYGKPRFKDEIYDRYYEKTKFAFAIRKAVIAERDLIEMQQALLSCGIIL